MENLLSFQALIAFLTLFVLELVLGIDNIIFIAIISDRLPKNQRHSARTLGLSLAIFTRLTLLVTLSWLVGLTAPLFIIFQHAVSGRDLIFLAGGLFLIAKSTHEIYQKVEKGEGDTHVTVSKNIKFHSAIIQIVLLDIVFSLDSVITAVGMVNEIPIMAAAIVASTGVMICASHAIADFVDGHPSLKMLALSFLVLIGMTLIADSMGQHIPKGYIYFAVGYSLAVEALNIRLRKKIEPGVLEEGGEKE